MLRWALIFLIPGGSAVRVHGHCFSRGRNCEISLFPLPGHVPDLLHSRHFGCEKAVAGFHRKGDFTAID
jgi:hypothetical protein